MSKYLFVVIFIIAFSLPLNIMAEEKNKGILSTCRTQYWYYAYNQLAKELRRAQMYSGSIDRVPCSGYFDSQVKRIANFPDEIKFSRQDGWTYDPMKQGTLGDKIFYKETSFSTNTNSYSKKHWTWDDNDPIWQDMPSGKGSIYDSGIDILLYAGDGSLTNGDKGFCNGTFYYFDNNNNNVCDRTEELWRDIVMDMPLSLLITRLQQAFYEFSAKYRFVNPSIDDYTGKKNFSRIITWDYLNEAYTEESVRLFTSRIGKSAYQFTIIPTHLEDGTQIIGNTMYSESIWDFYYKDLGMDGHIQRDLFRVLPIHFDEIRQSLNLNILKDTLISSEWPNDFKGSATGENAVTIEITSDFNFATASFRADFYALIKKTPESEFLLERFAQTNGSGNPKGTTASYNYAPIYNSGSGDIYPKIKGYYAILKWDLHPDVEAFELPVNSVPDTNNDNYLNLAVNLNNIKNETGTIFHTPDCDGPQVILPLRKNNYSNGSNPSYDFLYNGGANSSRFKFLHDRIDGTPFMYDGNNILAMISRNQTNSNLNFFNRSINYYLITDVYLNEPSLGLHVKRLSLIRPFGQLVTFNFPWNASKNKFEDIGVPVGINKERTYRLIYGLENDRSYSLQFEDGTIHIFYFHDFNSVGLAMLSDKYICKIKKGDYISYVGYINQSYYDEVPGTYKRNYFPTRGFKYDVDYEFNIDGMLSKLVYTPKDGNMNNKVTVELEYDSDNSGRIKKIKKKVPESLAINQQTEYEISIDGTTITYPDGSTSKREQTASAGNKRTVAITKTDPNSGTTVLKYCYNASDLLEKTEITANGNTETTEYAYYDSCTVYPNTTRSEHKLKTVKYPDGSWKYLTYNSNGWVDKAFYPYGNTPGEPKPSQKYTEYLYSSHETDDVVDEKIACEIPRTTIEKRNNIEISKKFISHTGTHSFFPIFTAKQCPFADSGWDNDNNIIHKTNSICFDIGSFITQIETSHDTSAFTIDLTFDGYKINPDSNNNYRTKLKTISTIASNENVDTNEVSTISNSRGINEARIITDSTSGAIVESAVSQTDSFYRITRTDYLAVSLSLLKL